MKFEFHKLALIYFMSVNILHFFVMIEIIELVGGIDVIISCQYKILHHLAPFDKNKKRIKI